MNGDWVLSQVGHGGVDLPQMVDLAGNNGKHGHTPAPVAAEREDAGTVVRAVGG